MGEDWVVSTTPPRDAGGSEGLSIEEAAETDLESDRSRLESLLPAGCVVCGLACVVSQRERALSLARCAQLSYLLTCNKQEDGVCKFEELVSLDGGSEAAVTAQMDATPLENNTNIVSVIATLCHNFSIICSPKNFEAAVRAEVDGRLTALSDERLGFLCRQASVVLSPTSATPSPLSALTTAKTPPTASKPAKKGKGKKGPGPTGEEVAVATRDIPLEVVACAVASRDCAAPSLLVSALPSDVQARHYHVVLESKVYGIGFAGASSGPMVCALALKLRQQLRTLAEQWITDPDCQPSPMAFPVPGCVFPLSQPYPVNPAREESGCAMMLAEQYLLPYRQTLHARCALATDRPRFRMANALDPTRHSLVSRLVDVHMGLPSSGVKGGVTHMIDGSYEYYHYLQDRFDDKGWGCAYRSLQTIVSWFRLQRYTQIAVPNHTEIQKRLVKIGSRKQSFVGTKDWIGATELSEIFDDMLGVQSKIVFIPSGGEIVSHAREIANHFDTQGTPIMMGGGALAYTLLGIDWNQGTGDVQFLILDPHYTGEDETKVIQDKGWCGWKTGDLFVKSSFYNLCMPQRPKCF